MFRELSRINKKISDKECIELLKNEKRGVLSVNGDDCKHPIWSHISKQP